jgi:hypothetical protein
LFIDLKSIHIAGWLLSWRSWSPVEVIIMVRSDPGLARSDNDSPVGASNLLKGVLARRQTRTHPRLPYKQGNCRGWLKSAPWWPARPEFSPEFLCVRQLNAQMIGRFRSPNISLKNRQDSQDLQDVYQVFAVTKFSYMVL